MIFDMLKRLRSVVYLPNDYVCKKVRGPRQPQCRRLEFIAPVAVESGAGGVAVRAQGGLRVQGEWGWRGQRRVAGAP